jgi:methylated-DNA-[protein]-cysteine S-methyltransferase
MREGIAIGTLESRFGELTLAASDVGLVRLALPGESCASVAEQLSERYDVRLDTSAIDPARRVVDDYLEGRSQSLDVAIDWRIAHGFALAALRELAAVPYGVTVSYTELAARAGNVRAARAAGAACATNPVAIVLPCHRVLGSDGRLHGYGGGLEMKEALLRLEGVFL